MHLVSIVVPCYNCEQYISNTVQTLLIQKNPLTKERMADYEIILVDDGSTDGTRKICDSFDSGHSNVRCIHKPNGGLVSAWKRGVKEAAGDYIVFCDADDHIDDDLVYRVSDIAKLYTPDMILYGFIQEYDNGDSVYCSNQVAVGFSDTGMIHNEILPHIYSDGRSQSEIIPFSRWSKSFKKNLLVQIMDDVPDSITNGEDCLTTFAALLNCSSLYNISDYYPYHYVRNSGSMIGAYDGYAFLKLSSLYREMFIVAEKYGYKYPQQILDSQLSYLMLYIKKEISRNPEGYSAVKEKLETVRASEDYKRCIMECSIKKYQPKAKIFAWLIKHKYDKTAYLLTKLADKHRGRNA